MNVNERLERLERSAGKGDHDLLLKLDALSRQITHFEYLLKQLEDANDERYRKLWREIDWLPRWFKGHLRLPFGYLLEVQLFPRALSVDGVDRASGLERVVRLHSERGQPFVSAEDIADNDDPEPIATAVHEKPRP